MTEDQWNKRTKSLRSKMRRITDSQALKDQFKKARADINREYQE